MKRVPGHLNEDVAVGIMVDVVAPHKEDQAAFLAVAPMAPEFLAQVFIERARQFVLWGAQEDRNLHEWVGILAEETGEVARSVNEAVFAQEPGQIENLLIELVQVAAVSLAFSQSVQGVIGATVPTTQVIQGQTVESKPIILLCGPVGSGKDSVAKHVIERYGFKKGSFARPLKKLCAEQFGWDLAQLDDLAYKEEFVPELNATRRQLLQRIGTEWFRSIDVEHWTKKACEAIAADLERPEVRGVVVSDLRFVNEAAAVRNAFPGRTVIVICITREDGHAETSGAGHASELEWSKIEANTQISAPFGRLPLLFERADEVLGLLDIVPLAS